MTVAQTLGDYPQTLRPYDRLVLHGAQCLSDAELVELLIRHRAVESEGPTEMVPPASTLLTEAGGLTGLLNTDFPSLCFHGLTEAEAVTVLAAGELSRRQARQELTGDLMTHPASLARYLFLRFGNEDQEVLGALFVDPRCRVIAETEIFRGAMNAIRVNPLAILRHALVRHACGIFLFHTHPGGEPEPSQEDLEFTRRMVNACEVVGFPLLDHMIVASHGTWVSLRQRGEGFNTTEPSATVLKP